MTDYNWNDAPDWATCVIQNKGAESIVYWASNLCAGATIQLIPASEMPVCKSVLSPHAVDDFVIVEFKPNAYAAPSSVGAVLAKLRAALKDRQQLSRAASESNERVTKLILELEAFGVTPTSVLLSEYEE